MWSGRAGALLRVWGVWLAGLPGRRPLSSDAASQAGSAPPGCWNCGSRGVPARGDGFFCPWCRALQPPDLTRDYFSLMDCSRNQLSLRHSFGYDSRKRANLHLLDSNTVMYIAGNHLILLNLKTKEQIYLRSSSGEGIGVIG
ncbi:iron-sulfur cluster co-chaperone protein HscB, mitochondrial-like, partial [Carlito syrichta]|uniref:Iron-sulfur cluster co-chaperone protein HscB, mitochondrial-like n=1 Tax=Carlito syrichta TaxID=1868482 RepID=A0A3Q0E0F9_CARSF